MLNGVVTGEHYQSDPRPRSNSFIDDKRQMCQIDELACIVLICLHHAIPMVAGSIPSSGISGWLLMIRSASMRAEPQDIVQPM